MILTTTKRLASKAKASLLTVTAMALAVTGGTAAILSTDQTAFAADPVTHTVCASGCDQTTIQAAVDAANPGDTVSVNGGSYAEVVTINKSIELVGVGATLSAPAGLPSSGGILNITGAAVNAEVTGLTVSGPGPSACGSIYAGIYVTGGAYANIHDLAVTSIRDSVFSGCQNGRAIYIGGTGVGTADVTNVTISDYQKGGVYVSNAGSHADISGNIITGAGPTATIAQNGIAVINGATANVSGNSVSGNNYTGPEAVATGILLFSAGAGTTVGPNTSVTSNEIGFYTTSVDALGNLNLAGVSGNTRDAVADVDGAPAPASVLSKSGLTGVADADGNDIVAHGGNLYVYGYSAFATIQAGINAVAVSGAVNVAAGDYHEDVSVNKQGISVTGEGALSTKIIATTGNTTPLTFNSHNTTVSGFTITHEYTVPELAAWNFNNNGVFFNQTTTGNTLTNSTVSLSRNGIYLNTTTGNTISNNLITNNRTGINMTGNFTGTQIIGNTISQNWTIGLVAYGTYAVDLSTVTVSGNTFDQNWYTEILLKNPAPASPTSAFTGILDVTNNTFTDSPVTYTTSSDPSLDEPGFAGLIPVALGGTSVKPAVDRPTLRIYNVPGAALQYTSPTLSVDPNNLTLSDGTTSVVIPTDTVVTPSDPSWNGVIEPPTATTVTVPAPAGHTATVSSAIQIGSSTVSLSFDKPVRINFAGQTGKRVGFIKPGGTFTEITTICGADDFATVEAQLNALGEDECKYDNGADLVVWTKHFTTFATYSVAVTPGPVGGGSGSGSSGSSSTGSTGSSTGSGTTTTSSAPNATLANYVYEEAAEEAGAPQVAGAKTTTGNVAASGSNANRAAEKSKNSRFLGLGWFWLLPIAALILGTAYYVLMKRAEDTDKA